MKIIKLNTKLPRRVYKREALSNRTKEEIHLYNRLQRSRLDNRIGKQKLENQITKSEREKQYLRSERNIYACGMLLFLGFILAIKLLGGAPSWLMLLF